MPENPSRRLQKFFLAAGLILLGVTFALNEPIMAGLFPAYRVSTPTGLIIAVFTIDAIFALIAGYSLLQAKSRLRIIADFLVGLIFTIILLAGIETGFYFINRQRDHLGDITFKFIADNQNRNVRFEGEHAQAFFQRDELLGYKPAANVRVIAARKKDGKILYRVTYSIDEYSRRVTPLAQSQQRPRFILFFGDSFTFGEGVNDDETMPFYVSQLAPDYKPYNYGAGGYGPQQMLAKLQSGSLAQEISEGQGIAVYTFINEHIARAIGSMRIDSQRGDIMPYYKLDAQGRLIRDGNFRSSRPLLSLVYSLTSQSQILKYFHFDLPLRFGADDLKLTARIIEESRNVFRDNFNSNEFYVLIYPTLGYPELLPYLEAAGIKYLDYSNLPEANDPGFWLGEGHPQAKAHQIVAEKVVQDLGLSDNISLNRP